MLQDKQKEVKGSSGHRAATSSTGAAYTSKDLKGLAIGHKVDSIKEGHQVILTLRDKGVLDEDEDVLENVNLLDNEKAAKNIENKKNKVNYRPYDDEEFDEFGSLKQSSLLSKYDEEIEGPKKDIFRIGETLSNAEIVRQRLEENEALGKVSLALPELKIASEYYTADEMLKFKKPKRKGTLRKRNLKEPKEEPLVPVISATSNSSSRRSTSDHASRSRRTTGREHKHSSNEADETKKVHVKLAELESGLEEEVEDELDLDLIAPDEELIGVRIEEDEAEKELSMALNKTRKLKLMQKKEDDFDIARIVQETGGTVKVEDEDEEELSAASALDGGSTLVLNTTAEFCRNLGDLPKDLYSRELAQSSKMKIDESDDDDDAPHHRHQDGDFDGSRHRRTSERMDLDEADGLKGDLWDGEGEDDENLDEDGEKVPVRNNWNEVDIKMEEDDDDDDDDDGGGVGSSYSRRKATKSPDDEEPLESKPILEEEPDVSVGVAGALKLAMNKGYLDKDTKKPMGTNRSTSLISAQSYAIEEKFYDDDRMGRRDRYMGQMSEFKEKEGYRPGFKLDYVDEKGRMMNQKEAFRYLSHKFHGKGPGKNKIDKRMKKMEQESKLRQMSSIDTPLNTLKLLQDKQKEVKAPYVVLSGQRATTSTAAAMTQISKKK